MPKALSAHRPYLPRSQLSVLSESELDSHELCKESHVSELGLNGSQMLDNAISFVGISYDTAL